MAPAPDPAMVSIRHAGVVAGTVYLAQDYVAGDALDVWMRDAGGALPAHRALGVVRAIARALDSAVEFSVGHGALHPRDIFIGATESDVRITGFGIAQALEEAGAKAPVRRPYAAPERVDGRDWDRRADIYSLAAIAQDLCPEAREAWGPALDRALSEDPAARFATATELANALAGCAVIVTAAEADEALASLPEEPARPMAAPGLTDAMPDGRADVPREPARPLLHAPVATADVDLPLPAKAPVDLGFADVDVELDHRAPAPPAPVMTERPFPWLTVAAVGFAMFVAGGALFYGIGLDRGRQERIAESIARVTPQPDPVPEPPAAAEITPEPLPSTRPVPSPVASPGPASPSPAPGRAAAPERSGARTGTVTVDSRPRGATVTIDGRRVGETPRAVELPPGVHAVLIQLTGHRPVRSTVDVVAGRQTRFAVTLEQLTGIPPGSVRKDR